MAKRRTEDALAQEFLAICTAGSPRSIFIVHGGAGHHEMGDAGVVQDHDPGNDWHSAAIASAITLAVIKVASIADGFFWPQDKGATHEQP